MTIASFFITLALFPNFPSQERITASAELKTSAADGFIGWNVTWGGAGNDFGRAVAVDPSGNVYVTGSTYSIGGDREIALVKYDSSGKNLRNVTWGGAGDDYGESIVVDSGGNVFVAGHTNSFGLTYSKIALFMFYFHLPIRK